jgi:hypothetical protein
MNRGVLGLYVARVREISEGSFPVFLREGNTREVNKKRNVARPVSRGLLKCLSRLGQITSLLLKKAQSIKCFVGSLTLSQREKESFSEIICVVGLKGWKQL